MVRKPSPERRAEFLRAALKLFVANGVQHTSTAAIAREAGSAAGTLFLYFPTKQDLIHELTLKIGREHLRLRFGVMAGLLRLSIGAIGQNLVETASWLLLVRIVAIFGSTVLAGYTIAVRVLMFALMPGWGLANAAATLVGQNLGAKQPRRADRSVWWCGLYNTIFLLGSGVALIAFSQYIIGVFTPNPEVVRIGAACLRTITCGLIAYGWGMVGIQAFNGAGDTLTPLWLNIVCFWMIKLPLAYFLAETIGWGPDGIWIAVTGSYTIQAVVVMALFRRGKWKLRVV